MSNSYGIIFLTTCNLTGKIYVGQTTRLWKSDYLGSGKYLKRAIKKYGKDNFSRVVLCEAKDKQELDNQEVEWIKKLKAQDPSIGYNIENGGNSIGKWTKEMKLNHSVRQTEYIANHPEYIKSISKSLRGENHPNFGKKFPQHSEKMMGENNPNFGNTWSEKQKQSQRDRLKGLQSGSKNPRAKIIKVIDTKTEEVFLINTRLAVKERFNLKETVATIGRWTIQEKTKYNLRFSYE